MSSFTGIPRLRRGPQDLTRGHAWVPSAKRDRDSGPGEVRGTSCWPLPCCCCLVPATGFTPGASWRLGGLSCGGGDRQGTPTEGLAGTGRWASRSRNSGPAPGPLRRKEAMETGNAKRRRLQGAVGKGLLKARAERVERKPGPVPWTRRKAAGVAAGAGGIGKGTLCPEPDSARGFCSTTFWRWHAGKMGVHSTGKCTGTLPAGGLQPFSSI